MSDYKQNGENMKKTIQTAIAAMLLIGSMGLTACAPAQTRENGFGNSIANAAADDVKSTANDLNNRALEKGKNALFNKLGL